MHLLCALVLCLQEKTDPDPPPDPAVQEPEPAPPADPLGLNAFNPSITVFGNALWRLDNKDVVEEEDGETIVKDDTFLLRETEVDFRAAVDPFAEGVLIVALEQEEPNVFEVDVEEGYALIKSLPFPLWEEPPLGTTIKVGRFRVAAGRHNQLHTHDLPQSQRGLSYETFLGEHGWVANGVSVTSLPPSLTDLDAMTVTFEAMQGGGFHLGEEGESQPAFGANLNWFWQLGDEHSVELGGSAAEASNDPLGNRRAVLYSGDFLYMWTPLREGAWNSIVVAGQVFYGSHELLADDPVTMLPFEETRRAVGGFAYAQYQLDRRWYVGLRGDRTELLEDRPGKDDHATRINPYVSCYVSEFFRLRVGYEHTWSDLKEDDDLDTFLFELNIVFGAHPPHPYWVNN